MLQEKVSIILLGPKRKTTYLDKSALIINESIGNKELLP